MIITQDNVSTVSGSNHWVTTLKAKGPGNITYGSMRVTTFSMNSCALTELSHFAFYTYDGGPSTVEQFKAMLLYMQKNRHLRGGDQRPVSWQIGQLTCCLPSKRASFEMVKSVWGEWSIVSTFQNQAHASEPNNLFSYNLMEFKP